MNSKVFALLLIAAVGVLADEYNCAAEGKVCQNGGICHDNFIASSTNPGSGGNGWQTPFCICKAPYGGPDCSYTIRECKDSPCQNGATCSASTCRPNDAMNQYDCFTCECAPGWTGAPAYTGGSDNIGGICDWPLPVNDCSVNQCYNGGVCHDIHSSTVSSFYCDCTAEWMPSMGGSGNPRYNCTTPSFNCTTLNPCLNGGTCNGNGVSCSCPTGYTTPNCGVHFCDSNPCMNGATCRNGNPGSSGCTCATGWTGTFCDIATFCSSSPCQNGATCITSGTQRCSCLANYAGTYCEVPPFCTSNPCQNGATCSNTGAGVGTCTNCPLGFAGKFCEKQLTGCGTLNVDCAVAHTTGYNSGLPNNQQKTCPCRDQATCAAAGAGVTFITNPFGTQGCQCNENAYDCRCNSTFVSRCPGNAGIPGQNVDMVCSNGATCVEHADGTMCSCRQGFWGPSCENYDNPCLNNPCKNGGRCQMTAETSSFFPGGMSSVQHPIDIALDDRYWGYMCTCKWPYYGDTCEQVASRNPVVCTGNECMNGATCGPANYDTSLGNIMKPVGNFMKTALPYNCLCNANYTGIRCETWKTTCANTPGYCQNGGNCVNLGSADRSVPGCICPCGWAGDRCELQAANADRTSLGMLSNVNGGVGYRLDFCSNSPCQNGGSCYNSLNGQSFMCVCKSGWGDRYCQTRVRSAAAGVVPSLFAVAAAVAVALALKN